MTTVSPVNPMDVSSSEYRSQLRDFIEYEIDVERERNRNLINSNDPSTLKRLDIGFLQFAQPLRFFTVRLRVEVPSEDPDQVDIRKDYELFENSEVSVEFGHFEEDNSGENVPVIDKSMDGQIADIEDNYLSIDFPQLGASEEDLEEAEDLCRNSDFVHIAELVNRTAFDREINAIHSLDDSTVNLLCGHQDAVFDQNSRALRESEPIDEDLYANQRQSEGISKALATKEISCIQGPPGTGKTRVIVELVRRYVNSGHKVLVTAETHQAVGNILVGDSVIGNPDENSLHYHSRINGFHITRVNPKPSKMTPFERNHYAFERGDGAVYASTNNSAATIVDPGNKVFDVAIIDEATQARQSSTYIPISIAERAILVGDHKQLGPHRPFTPEVDRDEPNLDFDAEESAFTRLYDDDNGVFGPELGVMFNQQYRMHPDIAEFPSREFYDSELSTGAEIERLNNLQPIIGHDIRDRDRDNPEENHTEAEAIVDYVSNLVNISGVPPSKIGIAASYRDQVRLLKSAFEQADIETDSILIQTFDSFQGSERGVMVLSFTRSNSSGDIGYLRGDTGNRRLNVAMTRAKHHCSLFGDWETLSRGNDLYERLRAYIDENGTFIEH